ncbi:MAG: hypothetical protein V4686_02430 [Patescibacteria group bacterium]
MFARIFFLLICISVTHSAHAEWYVSPLPAPVIGESVYIANSENEEIPHIILKQKLATTSQAVNYPALRVVESVGTINKTLVLDTSKEGQTYTGIYLTVQPDFKNFRKIARVFISDSLLGASSPTWREMEKRTIIYRYTDVDGFQLQNLKITFPDISSRYIKIQLDEDTPIETPISIKEVNIEYDVEEDTLEKTIKQYLAGNFDTPGLAATREIPIEQGVFTNSGDITHITVHVDDKLLAFRESVQIETSEDGTIWNQLHKGEVYRVKSSVFEGQQLTLTIPPTSSPFIRVVTNLPIEDTVTVRLQKQALLFKLDGSSPEGIQVHVDRAGTATSSYILQKELTNLGLVVPKMVTLELSEDAVAKRQLSNRYVIYSAIFLIAGILGYLRYRRTRKI